MANSFLIAASTTSSPAVASNVLALHYRTDRQLSVCKAQKFHHDSDSVIFVTSQPLAKHSTRPPDAGISAVTRPYIKGVQLSAEINQIISQPSWTITQVATFIDRYIVLLGQLASINLDGASQKTIIPRRFINALPDNIIIGADGTPTLIGTEFAYSEDFKLGFLVFRALTTLTLSFKDQTAPTHASGMSKGEFVLAVMTATKCVITPVEFANYENKENRWRHTVNRHIKDTPITWHSDHLLFQTTGATLAELTTKLDISRMKTMELQQTIDALQNSKIWKITRPLRHASDTFRKFLQNKITRTS
jgi:hypothetical protein